jgi:hypothetical protein
VIYFHPGRVIEIDNCFAETGLKWITFCSYVSQKRFNVFLFLYFSSFPVKICKKNEFFLFLITYLKNKKFLLCKEDVTLRVLYGKYGINH